MRRALCTVMERTGTGTGTGTGGRARINLHK